MVKTILRTVLALIILTGNSEYSFAQKKKKKSNQPVQRVKSQIKKYHEVIKKGTISDKGLFTVHQNNEKYYYEIPLNLLGKDMLLVSRLSKVPEKLGSGFINSGIKTNSQLVRWSRFHNNIHLQSISYNNIANDSLPIHISVKNNNYNPIIGAFKIEAFNKDSTAVVISVNKLFLNDVKAISGISTKMRKQYKVKSLDKTRSFISRISSYPENVEVRHDLTYSAGSPPSNYKSGSISIQMNQSMYLLPEKPMQPRLYDHRVGWFTLSRNDFGSEALKADKKTYLRRWRLEPKDPEAYARGELVEPIKPIVYYIDPATPKKWRPYFKEAVEYWQIAFEAAGFKNAILAKDPPSKEEDPEWSPEDARYSTIRYVASTTRNAMGPSVSDPRSGEIIESDIMWYHNHFKSYRNRYLIETGAANPLARTLNTPLAEIGEMIKMVIAHEVGHTLGLPHNMKASYAYPTDSLRSATFTNKWGLATTIMDYTRYNYVAQPGDKGVRWIRMLGPYDSYAINYGYRYTGAESPEAEKAILDSWIDEKDGDPMYLFGGSNSFDPSSQTECVGDDPVKASSYGLSNLKIVAKNLNKWTATPGEGYDDLKELYGELISVWSRYSGHVLSNVGGVYEKRKTTDDSGVTYTHLSTEEQKKSIQFLNENVFSTPTWLLQKEILNNIDYKGTVTRIRSLQARQLNKLLNKARLERMIDNEALNAANAYSLSTMLTDLRKGLWSELPKATNIDPYRRNIQRAHIERLALLLEQDKKLRSDISAAARAELKAIQSISKSASTRYAKGINRYHLQDIVALIDQILKKDKA